MTWSSVCWDRTRHGTTQHGCGMTPMWFNETTERNGMERNEGVTTTMKKMMTMKPTRSTMKQRLKQMVALFLIIAATMPQAALSFSQTMAPSSSLRSIINNKRTTGTGLFMSDANNNNNSDNKGYSREVMLRVEAESPFQKVRFFGYFTLAGGAFTSLFLSVGRIVAGLLGINTDLLTESEINAAVDLAGLLVVGFLWKRDKAAQDARLKRASKGAELAKLSIRASKKLADDLASEEDGTFTTNLASMRRGRGIEKRVVIATAGRDKINKVVEEAQSLDESLLMNDLVVVPVILPDGSAPEITTGTTLPISVALPTGPNWRAVVTEEVAEAKTQGVDVESEGIAIILKKNGRVGQRTKGIFLGNLIGDVVQRQQAGLDVKNI